MSGGASKLGRCAIRPCWLLGEKAKRLASPTHIYGLLNLGANGSDYEYYVVPSGVVKRRMAEQTARTGTTRYSFFRADAAKYQDAWKFLGRVGRRATQRCSRRPARTRARLRASSLEL